VPPALRTLHTPLRKGPRNPVVLASAGVLPLRRVAAQRYVEALREGGSVPGLLEADDLGTYVVKFHGAAQGPKALCAELIAGELGRALGLPVPDIVLVDLDAELGRAEPDQEIRELLRRSGGLNLGLDFLPGAVGYDPAVLRVDPALAARIVWFDAFVTNVDRTARNTNLLVWHRALWMIDHGAALYFHHDPQRGAERSRAPFPPIKDHVLLPLASDLDAADRELAPLVTPALIGALADALPDEWLGPDPAGARALYVEYLTRRAEAPRPFLPVLRHA
jgi:hypothetical protein